MVEHIVQQGPQDEAGIQELARLEAERQRQITRVFWMMLEIAFVFLVPALIVVFVVGAVWPRAVVWYVLPFSFLFSWGIVIVRYRMLSKKLGALDAQIKELQNKK
jgi:pheromone shutdown protein TraB